MFLKLCALLAVFAVSAGAHHSLAAYDLKKEAVLEGRIAQVLIRNPHSFLQMEVAGEDGRLRKWSIEWISASALAKQGITQHTLKPGDRITFRFHPPKSGEERRGALKDLHREADGFDWPAKQPKKQ
jgi:hypothetical protein